MPGICADFRPFRCEIYPPWSMTAGSLKSVVPPKPPSRWLLDISLCPVPTVWTATAFVWFFGPHAVGSLIARGRLRSRRSQYFGVAERPSGRPVRAGRQAAVRKLRFGWPRREPPTPDQDPSSARMPVASQLRRILRRTLRQAVQFPKIPATIRVLYRPLRPHTKPRHPGLCAFLPQ